MKTSRKRYIKIENRGKVSQKLLKKTEDFLYYIFYDLDGGLFKRLCPKMIYVLKKSELSEGEMCGFCFFLNSDIFKGNVEIRLLEDEKSNIYFHKRHSHSDRFIYKEYLKEENISLSELNEQFNFIIEGEGNRIKTGGVYELTDGRICIVQKYCSNCKIGINYDEYDDFIEEYIRIEQIKRQIR